jgi:Rieske Fe-S protein
MITKKGISFKNLDALAPLDGIVLEQEKLAAYRDNEGVLHVYSAVCTHLGCIVTWNGLGKVINGPANDPIQTEGQK